MLNWRAPFVYAQALSAVWLSSATPRNRAVTFQRGASVLWMIHHVLEKAQTAIVGKDVLDEPL